MRSIHITTPRVDCRYGRWRPLTLGLLLSVLLPVFGGSARADTHEIVSEPDARKSLYVTAYRAAGQETAFLREVREVDVPSGDVRIALQGVPDTVQRQSVALRVLEGPPLEVLEQTFNYDVMTPTTLLRAAEGSDITIDTSSVHDGKLRPVNAHVVAAGDEGMVVRTADGFTFGLDGERRRFASVPKGLTPRPTLVWHARSGASGKRRVEISYLLTGMHWSADYVATLSRDGRQMDLSGWVTFQNRTAAQFRDTHLAVAAGTVHRVDPGVLMLSESIVTRERGESNEASREALGHLHLYKIPHVTTLEPYATKNVHLLGLAGVPVDRQWVASFGVRPSRGDQTSTQRPRLNLEMRNDEKANAGIPIPGGTVRVMVPDRKGTPHLVASSSVVDTPKGEKLTIDMGPVADVKVRWVPTDYRTSLFGSKEAKYQLEVRNGSPHAGVVRVDLHPASNTTLELQGADVQRPSAATYRVEVPLGPGAARTIRVVATVRRPGR